MILVLDNYDSFTFNLVQEMAEIGEDSIEVVRNDVAPAAELRAREPRAVVISPGPGRPRDAGVSMDLVTACADLPLLGICLGHQAIAEVHGARIERASEPVHGKTSIVHHCGDGIFDGLPEPLEATRYHSLIVDRESLPRELRVTAWTDDGLVMAIADTRRSHFGVQFHPESYLSRHGMEILARFLEIAGVKIRSAWRRKSR